MKVEIEMIVVSLDQLWKKKISIIVKIKLVIMVKCGIMQWWFKCFSQVGMLLLCVIVVNVCVEVVMKVILVLNGEMKVFMYKRIDSQVNFNRIVKLVKGEEKLIFCQFIFVKVVGLIVLMKVICRVM